MEPTFQRRLLSQAINRPALRPKGNYAMRQVRGIVAHWTANEARGADARANWNYFNQGSPGPRGPQAASAHYIVDDKGVIQCLPDTEVGFHVGDKPLGKYKPAGLAMMKGYRGLTPNYFTVGFEMCVNKDGDWNLTYQHSAYLAAELIYMHGLTINHLYRHFDITGKACPRPMLEQSAWDEFRAVVAQEGRLIESVSYPAVVAVPPGDVLNVRSGPSATSFNPVLHTLLPGERVLVYSLTDGWAHIGYGRWVNAKYLQPVNTPAV
ncbi:MAG: N-acetylmuramoyl-L-alanine amidase [Saprospiraceae bacterium]|nr:N-acetylmuramoyl-L-alanine amidase [Saprospiraceae bacterium]